MHRWHYVIIWKCWEENKNSLENIFHREIIKSWTLRTQIGPESWLFNLSILLKIDLWFCFCNFVDKEFLLLDLCEVLYVWKQRDRLLSIEWTEQWLNVSNHEVWRNWDTDSNQGWMKRSQNTSNRFVDIYRRIKDERSHESLPWAARNSLPL